MVGDDSSLVLAIATYVVDKCLCHVYNKPFGTPETQIGVDKSHTKLFPSRRTTTHTDPERLSRCLELPTSAVWYQCGHAKE